MKNSPTREGESGAGVGLRRHRDPATPKMAAPRFEAIVHFSRELAYRSVISGRAGQAFVRRRVGLCGLAGAWGRARIRKRTQTLRGKAHLKREMWRKRRKPIRLFLILSIHNRFRQINVT